jgi:hypothetical protein
MLPERTIIYNDESWKVIVGPSNQWEISDWPLKLRMMFTEQTEERP